MIRNFDKMYHGSLITSLINFIAVPSLILFLIVIISLDSSLWLSSEINHFYIEFIAVILGSAISFYYIMRARVLNDNFSLFVGIGFCISVTIDLFHVITSFALVEDIVFLKYFIPQTWFAGRFFLGAMLLIAIIKYSSFQIKEEIDPPPIHDNSSQSMNEIQNNHIHRKGLSIVFYIGLLGIVAVITALSSLFLIFPASVLDDYSLHRPYEIPPLVLFCAVLYYFFKKQIYKKKDVIYKGLILYLVIDIFTQLTMSFSAASFDTAHNMAHVLKDIGYFVNIIALVLSSMQYITNQRMINEQIKNNLLRVQQAEKIKDDFINIAAHELRTPIQPILVLSELLRENIKNRSMKQIDPNEMETEVEIIHRNAQKLQKLTNDILDASKIDNNELRLEISKFDIKEVVTNIIKDFSMEIERKNQKVFFAWSFKVNGENILHSNSLFSLPLWIYGDKPRLTQVLSNLLNNAIKFTNEGTISIIIELNTNMKRLVVSVCDTGKGIDPEILPNLFKKFSSKSISGTGLGLFISKSIVGAHGGTLRAENNKDGKGSTFSFEIPLLLTD
ncbi:MAG TPA: ATP-binding protein [Candidatus Nitrosocosmicus sp.]|nr:ATP-binding protein [Candidatus Nitrosocosmicus sp.]